MILKDKQELVRLLNLYQDELLRKNEDNLNKQRDVRAGKLDRYSADYTFGIKAQFNHARLIARKLSVEISKEVKSYWDIY